MVSQDNWTLVLFFYAILLALTQFITKLKRTRPIPSHYDEKSWDNNAYMDWCCIKHLWDCFEEWILILFLVQP